MASYKEKYIILRRFTKDEKVLDELVSYSQNFFHEKGLGWREYCNVIE